MTPKALLRRFYSLLHTLDHAIEKRNYSNNIPNSDTLNGIVS
jgi:hypothetical protein